MRPAVHGTLDLLEREDESSALDAAPARARSFTFGVLFEPAGDAERARETAEVV
jgi:hypothetical protein